MLNADCYSSRPRPSRFYRLTLAFEDVSGVQSRAEVRRHRLRHAADAELAGYECAVISGEGRRASIKHFGSLDAIHVATIDEIAALKGIPREVAVAIKEHLG